MSDGQFDFFRDKLKALEDRTHKLEVEQRDHRKFHHEKINGIVMVAEKYFEDGKELAKMTILMERRLQAVENTSYRDIALAAAKEAVHQAEEKFYGKLGVNVSNFDHVEALRDDLDYLRTLRKVSAGAGSKVFFTIIVLAAGGLMVGTWEAIKAWIAAIR